jgi:hypothetical protein
MQLSAFFVSHGRWTVWTIGVLTVVLAILPEPQHERCYLARALPLGQRRQRVAHRDRDPLRPPALLGKPVHAIRGLARSRLAQYSLFANASTRGTPPVRPLFFEFPDEPELFAIDAQFLIGRDVLVTPVLLPNTSTVAGVFPGRGRSVWRDWYTHEVVDAAPGANVTLAAPLGHINVHVRDGAAILLHAAPAYTVAETRRGPFELLVTQAADGVAMGEAYVDDGESVPPTPSKVRAPLFARDEEARADAGADAQV